MAVPLSWGARDCCRAGARLGAITRAHFVEASQVEDVVKRQQRAQDYGEEKNETRSAQSAVGRARLLQDRTPVYQFKLKHAYGIFWIGRFMLAAVGIHRKES
jgi:hypothetical protein